MPGGNLSLKNRIFSTKEKIMEKGEDRRDIKLFICKLGIKCNFKG